MSEKYLVFLIVKLETFCRKLLQVELNHLQQSVLIFFAVILFHFTLSGLIDQQTTDLFCVLNAYTANFTLRKDKTSQSASVAFLYSNASDAILEE